ncbi:TetR/AcrR family transcriptional regulator [Tissierella sp. MSJ-40]|uniref:TetR/AcrR family transcriptional regulator n=1 Tax=Tissierella simiarum TaxID=2841534 RepID=A0ABS6E0S3_9FIRM|nr:TetR/AcrR family transcriptional regulator [Tissierella simiarum]
MEEKKEKSFEKRQELIDQALIEFGEKGYEQASLNNILKKTGISKGTFYYHFKNKEDLYIYLIDILAEEKINFFNKSINPEDFDKDIFTLLKIMIKTGIEFAHYRPEINKFSQSYLKDLDNPIFNKIKEKYNFEQNDYLGRLIDRAFEKGEFREDLPKEFIKSLVNYLFFNLQDISKTIDIDEYALSANYLIEFFKNGLAKK